MPGGPRSSLWERGTREGRRPTRRARPRGRTDLSATRASPSCPGSRSPRRSCPRGRPARRTCRRSRWSSLRRQGGRGEGPSTPAAVGTRAGCGCPEAARTRYNSLQLAGAARGHTRVTLGPGRRESRPFPSLEGAAGERRSRLGRPPLGKATVGTVAWKKAAQQRPFQKRPRPPAHAGS